MKNKTKTGSKNREASPRTKYGGQLQIAGFGPLGLEAAGEDEIFLPLLKNGVEVLMHPLQRIFIACLAFG
jgi:hypothetical protein